MPWYIRHRQQIKCHLPQSQYLDGRRNKYVTTEQAVKTSHVTQRTIITALPINMLIAGLGELSRPTLLLF